MTQLGGATYVGQSTMASVDTYNNFSADVSCAMNCQNYLVCHCSKKYITLFEVMLLQLMLSTRYMFVNEL